MNIFEGFTGKELVELSKELTIITTTSKLFKRGFNMKCPHCQYEFKNRTSKPKRCPLCQKWINRPKIKGGQ